MVDVIRPRHLKYSMKYGYFAGPARVSLVVLQRRCPRGYGTRIPGTRAQCARRDGSTATLLFPAMCTSNAMPPTATTVKQTRYYDGYPYARCSTNTTRRRFPSSSTPSPCAAWCGRGTPFFTERLTSSTTLRPWRWRRHWGLQVCTVYAIVFFAGSEK